jgi:hypothetical protein
VLDEKLLDEATRLSGERTYSRTVERALEESCGAHARGASWTWRDPASGREISPLSVKTRASTGNVVVVQQ